MQEDFHLNKWYLDFVSEKGEAMIFYAAGLRWQRLEVKYTSWLHYDPATGVTNRSGFKNLSFPEIDGRSLFWNDSRFGIVGRWDSIVPTLTERLFESDEGYLDWNCHQPASTVRLKINDRILEGKGYAEQLILTMAPWKLPMNELRWGRYGSPEDQLVWIEIKNDGKQQWVWHKGMKTPDCLITDDQIMLPAEGITLQLNRQIVLESEKKVQQLVNKLIRYLPGINQSMTVQFLMADECKWLSRATMQKDGEVVGNGWAIHEFVNFKHG